MRKLKTAEHIIPETISIHQLRRAVIAAPRRQRADEQPTPGPNHVTVPEECQKGKSIFDGRIFHRFIGFRD